LFNSQLAPTDADGNQRQPSKENFWKNENHHKAHASIAQRGRESGAGDKEASLNQSSREEGHAQQTQPVSSQHEPSFYSSYPESAENQ